MSPHATICHRHRRLIPDGGQCASCSSDESRRRGVKARAHGLWRAHWRNVRRHRLELAEYQCEIRLEGCTGIATTVHLSPALEGRHDEATVHDCKAACRHCHGVVDALRKAASR